nr:hypothetical protein [Tanacetum cinerariifolium]
MTHPPSPYQSTLAKNASPTYQSNPATNASSTYQFAPATKAPPAYESTPATIAPSAYQSNPTTNAPLTYQFAPTHPSLPYQFAPTQPYHEDPTINHSPIYESSPTSQPTRGPSWKKDGGFKSNYLGEVHRRILVKRPDFSKKVSPHIESKVKWLKTKFHIVNDMLKQSGCLWNDVEKKIACERQWYDNYSERHKEAKRLWDVPFPYFSQLELVYGRDRATGVVAEGFKDVIQYLEEEKISEIGGENLGESHFFLSDDEGDVQSMPQTTSNFNNAAKTTNKQKVTFQGNKAVKKRKLQEVELEGIDRSFQMLVQGFNANFGTMENVVAHSMTDENMRQKATSEKLKDYLDKLVKLKISTGDVLHAGEIFVANKEKLDLFMNLPDELRVSYVYKLIGLSSGN